MTPQVIEIEDITLPGVPSLGSAGATQVPKTTPRHVTLIRPAMVSSTGTWSSPVTPPLGLAYLAAMLREAGHDVEIIDAIAENIDQFMEEDGYIFQGLTIEETVARINPKTEMIGLSCMFSQDWPVMRALANAIKNRFPAVPLVAGGEHITALPEFSLENAPSIDVCVLGEGEETLVDLARNLGAPPAKGDNWSKVPGIVYRGPSGIIRTEPRKRIRAVDAIPWPAWDLFPMEVYLNTRNGHGVFLGRSMGILATRGCPYKCTFCSNPVMYGNLWMPREPADVLDEIEHYIHQYDVTNIDFYDLTFILRKSWIIEFCRLIEERGLKFTWQLPTGTRSEVIDDEVSAAIYRTGCRNVTYAPESGSEDTLRRIKKQVSLPKLMASTSAALRNGIHVKCNIIIGFPHETRRHIWETLTFAWKLAWMGVHDAGIFLFSPYPGSALFDELRAEGKIGELNDSYFKSLVAFMDPLAPSVYCRHVRGRELALWRFFGMATFFVLQYLRRPVRFIQLVKNVWHNESETVLEQRLGAILRRPKGKHLEQMHAPTPASASSAVASRVG